MKTRGLFTATLVAVACLSLAAIADTARMINYQGVLRDDAGNYVHGTRDLTFTAYPDSLATSPMFWTENHPSVEVANGVFDVQLGRYAALSDALFNNQVLWLAVSVDGGPEMAPRMRMSAVPWAFRSAIADQAMSLYGGAGGDGDWTVAGSDMYAAVSGNVGVGTAAPVNKVEIDAGNTADGLRVSYGDSYPGLCGELIHAGSGGLRLNSTTGSGIGSWADISFQTNNSTKMFLNHVGDLGLGTDSPTRRIHVDGGNAENGLRVAWGSNYGSLYGEFVHKGSGGLVINSNAGGSWANIYFQTEGSTKMTVRRDGKVGIGTTAPEEALHVVGTAKVEVLKITGADLAENFPVRDEAEPGTVVSIDHERPGRLRVSDHAYDRRVAGVISGAGDLEAGAVLGNMPGSEDDLPVALSGRVWVKCDASGGAVAPGDLLTTAGTSGHAMKVVDRERAQGAVLGKAMTGLESGRGLVLVLVSLQ